MSLIAIVRTLGGDLYDGGRRAVIPGPGHSRSDRSVSLLLSEGRVVVHSFGRSTWREVVDELRARGCIDTESRPIGGPGGGSSYAPDRCDAMRADTARRLWIEASPLRRQLSMTHVRRRGVARRAPVSEALRHHPGVRLAIYADQGPRRPALLAAVSNAGGELCAVEVTYLDPNGSRACGVAISRKVIGVLPAACAVRLDPPGAELLVGEGVFTTLSASARFGLPGWALLSTRNLRTWSPPQTIDRVVIAADRGVDGERSARRLQHRLAAQGVVARVAWPRLPAQDWNEASMQASARAGEGEGQTGAPSGWMVRSPAWKAYP